MADPTDPTDDSGPVTSPDSPVDASTGVALANALTDSNTSATPTDFGQYARGDDGQLSAPGGAPQAAPGTTKIGIATRGVTPQGVALANGQFAQADARTAAFAAQDQQRSDAENATMQGDYAAKKQANQAVIDTTSDYQTKQQSLYQAQINFNHKQASDEARINGETQAERAKYLATYKEQLAGVQALAMHTGNPLENLSKGQALGLMGAQFAQGFLAARGIKIDVSGQIDKWVDRSIQEHQQMVQNARQGAEDTLHLYDIARQSANDDWEARQRYRGFVVQGLQTGIAQNADMLQSGLAKAHAQESIAQLQIDADTTARGIADRHAENVRQEKALETTRTNDVLNRGIEYQKLDLMKAAAKARAAAAAAVTPDMPQYIISDNKKTDAAGNAITGGQVQAIVNPNAKGVNEAMKNLNEARGYKDLIDKGTAELDRLRSDKDYGKWINDTTSEKYREFDGYRQGLKQLSTKMMEGKRQNQSELNIAGANLIDDKAWQSGTNSGLTQNLRDLAKQAVDANYKAGLRDQAWHEVAPQDVDSRMNTDKDGYMPPEREFNVRDEATIKARETGGEPKQTAVGSEQELADYTPTQKRVGPDTADEDDAVASKLHQAIWGPKSKPNSSTDAVDRLAYALVSPDYFREIHKGSEAEAPNDNGILAKQSLDALTNIATGHAPATPMAMIHAQRVLEMYKDGSLATVAQAGNGEPTGSYNPTRLLPNGDSIDPSKLPPGATYDIKTGKLTMPPKRVHYDTRFTEKKGQVSGEDEDE